MKQSLVIAAVIAAAVTAYVAAQAQEATPFADSTAAFAQLTPDASGTVSQRIMHAPAGDVLAVEIGRTPRGVYTKQDDLFYVVSGDGTANVGYPSYALHAGSVLSVPRNTAFQISSTGQAPLRAILIASPADNSNDKRVLEP